MVHYCKLLFFLMQNLFNILRKKKVSRKAVPMHHINKRRQSEGWAGHIGRGASIYPSLLDELKYPS